MAYKLPKDEVWQCMNCKWVPAKPRKWVKKCKRCENIGCLCPTPKSIALPEEA